VRSEDRHTAVKSPKGVADGVFGNYFEGLLEVVMDLIFVFS
jgi:hypothetical protein